MEKGEFQGRSHKRANLMQRDSQYTEFETLQYSLREDAEVLHFAGDGTDIWIQEKLVTWKRRSQRDRDWKCYQRVKAVKKQPKEGSFSGRHQQILRPEEHPAETAMTVVRHKTCVKLWSRTRSGKSGNDGANMPEHGSDVSYPTSLNPKHSNLISSNQPKSISSNLLVPYENFVGAILGSSFRLLGFLRSENHGDIYAAEDLIPLKIGAYSRYETKAYLLRGIDPKLHGYRVRNLRKLKAETSFVTSIEQNGRVFIVYVVDGESGKGLPTRLSSIAPKNSVNLGAIGQRRTPEFTAAFPGLSKLCQSHTAESSVTSERNPVALPHKDYASALRHEINDTK
jgi:hypothetical protein